MNTSLEKLASAYTEALLKKLSDKQFWTKPWITVNTLPRNIRGTSYSGGNLFFLSLVGQLNGYGVPVYLTFKQARDRGLSVLRGEKGFPVERYIIWYVNKEGQYLSEEDYCRLSAEQKENWSRRNKLSCYTVFNVEQTNIRELEPELYEKMSGLCVRTTGKNCPYLDELVSAQRWDCPIDERYSAEAYYSPGKNRIVIPERGQFRRLNDFYSTLLHEMSHSTISPTSMNRERKTPEGVNEYAHEELIAEMCAGLTCAALGLERLPSKDNTAYIQAWLGAIKQDNQYIFNCISEIKKISKYICDKIGFKLGHEIGFALDSTPTPEQKAYLDSCNKSYTDGDIDLLPEALRSSYGKYESAWEEAMSMRSGGSCHPEDIKAQVDIMNGHYRNFRQGLRNFLGLEQHEESNRMKQSFSKQL